MKVISESKNSKLVFEPRVRTILEITANITIRRPNYVVLRAEVFGFNSNEMLLFAILLGNLENHENLENFGEQI